MNLNTYFKKFRILKISKFTGRGYFFFLEIPGTAGREQAFGFKSGFVILSSNSCLIIYRRKRNQSVMILNRHVLTSRGI